jgi:hypothetical protein
MHIVMMTSFTAFSKHETPEPIDRASLPAHSALAPLPEKLFAPDVTVRAISRSPY